MKSFIFKFFLFEDFCLEDFTQSREDKTIWSERPRYTPYQVVFWQESLPPVELAMESWRVVDWLRAERAGKKRAELVALRARPL